jgi:pimeloyl-ACP methyl ester carboxylesterase
MSRHGRPRRFPIAFWVSMLAVAILLLGLGALFSAWKSRRLAELEAGSGLTLLQQGVMEFAERGDGPVVLVIHGSPGGYDQGLVYGNELVRRGFRVLSVSRPGYLRTPLETGATFAEQADAISELLTQRGITVCGVLGISEGSDCAMELASRHPEQVSSLVLLSPPGGSLDSRPIASIGYRLFHDLTGDVGCWLLSLRASWNPRQLFADMMGTASSLRPSDREAIASLVMKDPDQQAFLKGLARSVTPLSPREHGIINDNAELKDLSPASSLRISSPLLVLTGEHATATPFESLRKRFSAIPGSRLEVIPEIGHLLPVGARFSGTWDGISSFLKAPPRTGTTP